MKRRDFICGLTCLAAGLGIGEMKHKLKQEVKCNNPTIDEYIPTNEIFNEIYVETTSHCNIACKGCDAYSPLSKPEFVEYEQFSKDFHKIKELFPERNINLLFLGGEPLLNPDLVKMIKLHRKLFPKSNMEIMTNGLLLHKMDKEFWETVKEADVELRVTYLPLDIDRTPAEKLINDYGIRHRYDVITSNKLYDVETREVTKTGLDIHVCHRWGKNIVDLSGSQDYIEKKYTCKHSNFGQSYIRGNLYFCWIHSHINAFSEYFNVDIPITKNDYLKISEVKDAKEIDDFVNAPNKLCRFCKQCHNTCFGGKPVEWEFSKKEISEWT